MQVKISRNYNYINTKSSSWPRMSHLMRLRSLKQEDTAADADQQSDEEHMLPAVFPPGLVALFFFTKLEHAVRTQSRGWVLLLSALLLLLVLLICWYIGLVFVFYGNSTTTQRKLCCLPCVLLDYFGNCWFTSTHWIDGFARMTQSCSPKSAPKTNLSRSIMPNSTLNGTRTLAITLPLILALPRMLKSKIIWALILISALILTATLMLN